MEKEPSKLALKEHIRQRPAMYLGAIGSKGICNLIKGLILDTNRALRSEKNFFHFSILSDNSFELKITTENEIEALSIQSDDENITTKFHFKIFEALVERYEVEKEGPISLRIKWEFNRSILEDTSVDFFYLSEVVTQVAFLYKESEILLSDHSKKYPNQLYCSFPEGVKYLYERCKADGFGAPEFELAFDGAIKDKHYQIFVGYRTAWSPNPQIISFANEIHTICGGSLVKGIYNGLYLGCRAYGITSNLAAFKVERKKLDNGLILVCAVKGEDLQYGGSFKESLIDIDIEKTAESLIKRLTLEFIEKNKEKAAPFLRRFDQNHLTSATSGE